MYNRYVRNDDGAYQRIPYQQEETPPRHTQSPPPRQEPDWEREAPKGDGGKKGFLKRLLGKLKLDDIDTGDLLLLLLLLVLFSEGEDEELLIALGLLLLL